ncbi:NUDIX hydrolase [Actinokineospora sp. NPDC004072]
MRPSGPRVGAYVVCLMDGKILLSRMVYVGLRWMLPGGGLEHGEDPVDAAVREVFEETGYTVEIEDLLGLHTYFREEDGESHHALRVVYTGRITGGELTHEVGGSSDMAAWFPLAEVPTLQRATLVDLALQMLDSPPRTGRIA